MHRPIPTALLGAGRAGREHAKNLGTIPLEKVVCVCDPVPAAAAAAASHARADRICVSVDEVFASREIEAVVISTLTEKHTDYMERAARAGKAFFCKNELVA